MTFTFMGKNHRQHPRRRRPAVVVLTAFGTLLAPFSIGVVAAPGALASPALPCSGQIFTGSATFGAPSTTDTCTVEPGETVTFTIKAPDGGPGGAGGNYYNGAAGGTGGLGGSGGKVTGTYTNSTANQETLTVIVGTWATPGVAGQSGTGLTPTGNNGTAGSPGTSSSLIRGVADDTIVTVVGGGAGGGGGGAQSAGTPGTAGTTGADDTYSFPVGALPGNLSLVASTWSWAKGSVSFVPPTPPAPPVVYPPGAPTGVKATAGDARAAVEWTAPEYSGSYAVTDYQVTSVPGGRACLATAPDLACEVVGLTNGVAYTFTVRALNGAGWGADSDPSNVVRPSLTTIQISGSRSSADARYVQVSGMAAGLAGERLTPYLRFPGESDFTAGVAVVTVKQNGSFAWQRKAGRKITIYFGHGEAASNTITIAAR